jgi:hypothetical protein
MHGSDVILFPKSRTLVHDEEVPPKGGTARVIEAGQHLRIIDVMGKQAGDLALFNAHNTKEKMCCNLSRSRQMKPGGRYKIQDRFTTSDTIYSTGYQPMATIVADTAVPGGRHETELHSCNIEMYERLGLTPPEGGGCWEILSRVLATYGIAPEEIPDTFDVFANLVHDPAAGEWHWEEPVTRPGDYIEFRAEMDLIAGLSVCPMDFDTPLNGWVVTPLHLQVFDVEM